MLLRYSLGYAEAADAIEKAVTTALEKGARTTDIAEEGFAPISTTEMGDRIASEI